MDTTRSHETRKLPRGLLHATSSLNP
jgi:hypothetical protein